MQKHGPILRVFLTFQSNIQSVKSFVQVLHLRTKLKSLCFTWAVLFYATLCFFSATFQGLIMSYPLRFFSLAALVTSYFVDLNHQYKKIQLINYKESLFRFRQSKIYDVIKMRPNLQTATLVIHTYALKKWIIIWCYTFLWNRPFWLMTTVTTVLELWAYIEM